MKKSVYVCVVLLVALLLMPTYANAGDERVLSFDENGKFKIMIIADVQDGKYVSDLTLDFMEAAIASENPDFVVFSGDNIFGFDPLLFFSKANIEYSIDSFLQPVVKRNIPFTFVFGNHDPETLVGKQAQYDYYRSFPNCLTYDANAGKGLANHNLLIYDNQIENVKYNLWFFDSGNMAFTEYGYGYDFVSDEQIDWYHRTSDQLKEENGGTSVPSMVFQQIPVPEIYDVLEETDPSTPGAVQGRGIYSEKYYVLKPEFQDSGILGEGPCPPDYNNGQFDSWVEQGDVVAAFFGHDHVNDFVTTLQGVDLVMTPGVGVYDYGNGYQRGVRVIELDVADTTSYTTRSVHYSDFDLQPIPEHMLYEGYFFHSVPFYCSVAGIALVLFGIIATIVVLLYKVHKKRKGTPKTVSR
jgi:hypothetical protein